MPQAPIWKIEVLVPDIAVDVFSAALEPLSVAVTTFEIPGTATWKVEGYAPAPPDHDRVMAAVALAARQADVVEPSFLCMPVEDRDWVGETQRATRPIAAGRFFVHPSFYDGGIPAGCWPIEIDAGTAFGTGDHATTSGCLIALSELAAARRFAAPLDVGTGSGILAIAMARAWPCRPVATDIDREAVRVARQNARLNGVAGVVHAVVGAGLSGREIARRAPFDLIVANILARPLKAMAPGIARSLAPGGIVILSGILDSQERDVLAAYRPLGFGLRRRINRLGWCTLVLAGP